MNAHQEYKPAPVTALPTHARLRESAINIPSDQLEQIVRRASDLQRMQGVAEPGQLTEEDVLRIGAEVGLEARYLRRAIAEAHAQSLQPPSTDSLPFLDYLCGPSWVRAQRVVAGSGDSLQRRVEAQLSGRESLKEIRRRSGLSVWEPASGWIDHIQRGLDFSGHGYELASARGVELTLAPVERDYSMVTLGADLSNQRNAHLWGWGGGFGGPALAAGVIFGAKLGAVMTGLVGIALASVAVVAVGLGARWSMANVRRRIAMKLESVLDRVDPEGG